MFRSFSFLSGQTTSRTPSRTARPVLEALEHRVVPAAAARITATFFDPADPRQASYRQLTIEGTPGNDPIDIRQEGGFVSIRGVTINVVRVFGSPPSHTTDKVSSAMTAINVYALEGHDRVLFQTIRTGTTADARNRAIPMRVFGGGGNDQILGGGGNDVLVGGEGADTIEGGAGNDTVYGDAQYAGVKTTAMPTGWFVSIRRDGTIIVGPATPSSNVDDLDFFLARENASRSGNDILKGGDGNDALYGGYGNDQLYGGSGNDDLFGMLGADLLSGDGGVGTGGQPGNDRLFGGAGADFLSGEGGHDLLLGADGDDTMYGGDGNDSFLGGNGNDRLFGMAGNDVLCGEAGKDYIDGGAGDDFLSGGDRHDKYGNWVIGGAGRDTFYGFEWEKYSAIGTSPIFVRTEFQKDALDVVYYWRLNDLFWWHD